MLLWLLGFHVIQKLQLQTPRTPETLQALYTVTKATKWPEAYAISDQSSETIARLLVENVICRHGVPKELLSEAQIYCQLNLMLDICDIMGMKKVNTTAYHPQTNGNFNRTHRTMIAKHRDLVANGMHISPNYSLHIAPSLMNQWASPPSTCCMGVMLSCPLKQLSLDHGHPILLALKITELS